MDVGARTPPAAPVFRSEHVIRKFRRCHENGNAVEEKVDKEDRKRKNLYLLVFDNCGNSLNN